MILGNYKNLYKPKLIFGLPNSIEYQRIFGEINVDGLNVSHTKDDFNFGSYEDELLEKLKIELEDDRFPLLEQAKNYRLKEFDENMSEREWYRKNRIAIFIAAAFALFFALAVTQVIIEEFLVT